MPYRPPTPDEQTRAVAALNAVRDGDTPDLTDLPLCVAHSADHGGHPFTLLSDGSTPIASLAPGPRESRAQPPRVTPSGPPNPLDNLLNPSPPNHTAPGWGAIALHEESTLLIEVPHPGSDRYTARLGLELFNVIPTAALLVAGVHRDHADVAHLPESIFHAFAQTLATTELQLHGFATTSAPGTDAILSPGAGEPVDLHDDLEKALTHQGFRVGHHEHLAGRTNVQGRAAARRGTPFLHLELAALVRRHHRHRVVEAVTHAWDQQRQ